MLTAGLYAWADRVGFAFRVPLDAAIQEQLRTSGAPTKLDAHIRNALARDDVAEAEMYVDIAAFLNVSLAPDIQKKIKETMSFENTILRTSAEYGTAFLTGQGETTAGLAGALTSDVSVIGDIRDITVEGSKYVAGADYDQIVLGLAIVGLVATPTSDAGGAVAKADISLLKIAKRTNKLPPEFTRLLSDQLTRAIDYSALKTILSTAKLTDLIAAQETMTAFARTVKTAPLQPMLTKLSILQSALGPAETLRILKFATTTANLNEVTAMTERVGKKSRGIMELTGITALHGFKTSTAVIDTIKANAPAWIAWFVALGAMLLARGLKLFGPLPSWPTNSRRRRLFGPRPFRELGSIQS
jgi:hypothetical protein